MFFIYDILFVIIFWIFVPMMIFKLIKRPGYKRTFFERFAVYGKRKLQLQELKNCIWIHAVSVGEGVVACNMINAWLESNPDLKIVISTTTSTGQQLVRDKTENYDNVHVIYCPLDVSFFIKKTLKILEPRMLVIFETELWPNMINISARMGVKVCLVNARMSDKSCEGYYKYRFFFSKLLKKFSFIGTQSYHDEQRFKRLLEDGKIMTTGNMKFDQEIPENLDNLNLDKYFDKDYKGKIILAASTHDREEELILRNFLKLKQIKRRFKEDGYDKKGEDAVKLIIMPRHAERGSDIESMIKDKIANSSESMRINYERRSTNNRNCLNSDSLDVILADTTGEMLQFINRADIVIMGKSLAGHDEGHNLIEPALLKKAIICGKKLTNFRFILQTLKTAGALTLIDRDEQLTVSMQKLLDDQTRCLELGNKAFNAVQEHCGATAKNIKHLEDLL